MDKKECNFWLKEPNSQKESLIYFNIALPDGDIKRSVKRKILPAEWDFESQRPSKDRKLLRYLDDIEDSISDLKSHCRHSGTVISCDLAKGTLDTILQDTGKKRGLTTRNMFTDFRTISTGMRNGTVLTPDKKKKRYAESTILQFESSTNIIEEFFTEKKLSTNIELVTMDTYDAFFVWCHGRNLSNNYIGTLIKRWKILAKISRKNGWHTNMIFQSEDFVKITEETDDIFLTDEKIQAIAKTNVGLPGYDIARDWFVLDCYLGLRVSDLLKITKDDFEGNFFQLINKKTGAKVVIPINPTVRRIIKRYKGLPPAISDSTLNEYIKVVARKSGLKAKFIYKVTKGGILQIFHYQEWEMVSAHTCRRTFITNLCRKGIPPLQVMMLAGIEDYDTLMRYFKQSAMEVAEDVQGHKFFTGK
jgi:site-specific recombinase XerD